MKEIDVPITHEMIVKCCEMYTIVDLKQIVNAIKSYINIEKTEIKGNNLSLYGTKRLVGYKVEDGGFYDVYNDMYYYPIQLGRSVKIIELKKIEGYVKKKVR